MDGIFFTQPASASTASCPLVTQRTRELGLRMVLGARQTGVLGLVLRDAMTPVMLGAAGGLLAAAVLTNAIRSLLFGVTPLDPLSLLAAPTLLIIVALIASYLPARRATRFEALNALRDES
jgi:ABC-type antimicrobial peptide transport system permease subunit